MRAWQATDDAVRRQFLETCYAVDGRFVMRTRELRGREALLGLMRTLHADPSLRSLRLVSVLDVIGNTFRFRAAGLVRTFTGPLTDAGG